MVPAALVSPAEAWTAWTVDPAVVLGLVTGAILYARGASRLVREGRGAPIRARIAAFAGAELAIAVGLVSPLDAVAESLFSAHMVQHLVLMIAAAPLLVLSRPARTVLAGLSPHRRRSLARAVTRIASSPAARALRRPAVAWIALTGVLWAWHLPTLYGAALEHPVTHALEHAAFLGASALAWSVALASRPREGLGVLGRALFLVAAAAQGGLLGALLLFASTPLYPVHGAGPALWGLSPLQDQQLAGAIMWIPPSVVYLGSAAGILVRRFRALEDHARPSAAAAGVVSSR